MASSWFGPRRKYRQTGVRRPRPRRSVRLQVELLENRLTPSWGSVPPATVIPPTEFESVTLDAQADATGNAAITNNEIDWYQVTSVLGGRYLFEATTPTSNLDTVIGLYSSTGSRLGYNDDYNATNYDSRFTITLSAGQTFFFGVTNYLGKPGGTYTWRIDGPAPITADDSFEENDTQAQASNLGTVAALRTITGLVMADGHDWYQFQMNGTGTTSHYLALSSTSTQGDLDLELYNASGSRLGLSNSATNTERISLNGRTAGTYFVHVLGYQGASTPSYTLEINPATATTPPPPPTSPGFNISLNITGMTASQRLIFQEAAARWQQVIVGDLPSATYNGQVVDDVLIDASGAAIDGPGGVLGEAGPDRFRSGTFLPYHGSMEFDTADLASMEQNGSLRDVILHEMGHVLGIGTIWSRLRLVTGAGGSNPRFTGAQATAAYNEIFGRNETSVPVENTGGPGTQDSHWRESVLRHELMTGYIGPGSVIPLSRITVASLADLGYQVDLTAADPYTPPGAAGLVSSGGSGGGTGSRLVAGAQIQGSSTPLPFLDLSTPLVGLGETLNNFVGSQFSGSGELLHLKSGRDSTLTSQHPEQADANDATTDKEISVGASPLGDEEPDPFLTALPNDAMAALDLWLAAPED